MFLIDRINLMRFRLTSVGKAENVPPKYLTAKGLFLPLRKIIGLMFVAAVVVSLTLGIAPNNSYAGSTANMNQCADKAVYGKGKKLSHIKIEGHHFHCYPALVSYPKDKPGVVRIAGRLDHDIRNFLGTRPDDEVYFGFDIKNGRLIGKVKTKVVKGGFAKTLSAQMRRLLNKTPDWRAQAANFVAGNAIEKRSESLIRKIGSRFTGRGWETAAKKILDRTVERAKARYR